MIPVFSRTHADHVILGTVSLRMTATRAVLWQLRRSARRALSAPTLPADYIDPDRLPSEPTRSILSSCEVDSLTLAERTVFSVQARGLRRGDATTTVLYFHGGSYSAPLSAYTWWMIERMARLSGAKFLVPDYPLAPEHTAPDAWPLLDASYALAATSSRLVLAGDSAGGGLAFVQAMRARDMGQPPADAIVAFSPWVDVTVPQQESVLLQRRDPVSRIPGGRILGQLWAGALGPTHPLVSPIYGDLENLPPATIIQGERDVLTPDVVTFAERYRAAGNSVELEIQAGGFHVYPLAWWTPESRKALARAARVVRGGCG